MEWSEKGFIPFRLEVLTPVFIGSGEPVSPLEYVLGVARDTALYHIDIEEWIAKGARKDQVDVLGYGDMRRIRKMLQDSVDPTKFAISKVSMSKDLRDKLLSNIGNRDSNNKNEISATMRNSLNGVPYLPGSSLKGAISTPLINQSDIFAGTFGAKSLKQAYVELEQQGHATAKQDWMNKMQDWMNKMFGKIDEHTMKALKVSDCTASADAVRIVEAIEKGLEPDKNGTPKPPVEAIVPGSILYGRMMLAIQRGKPCIIVPGMNNAVMEYKTIRNICNEFYKSRYKQEKERFYKRPHFRKTFEALKKVDERLDILSTDNPPLLLRIGHYSHIECVTVTRNNPIPRQRRDRKGVMPIGTTRTLADGEFPFGWVLLHQCSNEEYVEHARREEILKQQQWEHRVFADIQAAHQAQECEAERRRMEAEHAAQEELKRKAEAEKTAMRAAMPEYEQIAVSLREDCLSENEVMSVYNGLDKWTGEEQKKIALALKDSWMKCGKWDGKQSKKQMEKIKKIKSIIG